MIALRPYTSKLTRRTASDWLRGVRFYFLFFLSRAERAATCIVAAYFPALVSKPGGAVSFLSWIAGGLYLSFDRISVAEPLSEGANE